MSLKVKQAEENKNDYCGKLERATKEINENKVKLIECLKKIKEDRLLQSTDQSPFVDANVVNLS